MLVILRKVSNGGQLPIRVDLNEAIRDPNHRILIQPGDILILQQTPGEALARYATGVVNFAFGITRPFVRGKTSGSVDGAFSLP